MNPRDRLLERAAAGHDIREEAARLVAAKKAAKSARARRLAPRKAPRLEKEAREDAAHAAETARIRAFCVKRAAGFGELCGEPLDMERAELCHLDGGSGKRRQNQSVRNCVMEHHSCHQGHYGLDVTPRQWIPNVQRWAERHGYGVPERFRKLEILRAPVPASRRDAAPTENR